MQFKKRLVAVALMSTPLLSAGLVFGTLGGCAKALPGATPTVEAPSFVSGPALRGRAALPRQDERRARHAPEFDLMPNPMGASNTTGPSSLLPGGVDLLEDGDRPVAPNGLCPPDMASVDDQYCIDRYEASLQEILPNGDERPWSAYLSIDGRKPSPVVRAVSAARVIPQGYISELQAKQACGRSGKRLCKPREWKKACMGPAKTTYPYGATNEPRRCNDHGRAPMAAVFGLGGNSDPSKWGPRMNDPQLNQVPGTLAATGTHDGCTNGYGVYDMVGNVHEWVDDPEGTFLGGYYLDTHENGNGCEYRTGAHDVWYHDYSTGFRCCADVAP